jgi:hypothetical protein
MPEIALTHHDLPPRWDGWPVTWQGWEWFVGFVCFQSKGSRPRQDVCHRCGHVGEQPMNRGHAEPVPWNGRRVLLLAFRCPGCRHDTVWAASQWWDLEPADYLDAGSTE